MLECLRRELFESEVGVSGLVYVGLGLECERVRLGCMVWMRVDLYG